MNDKKVKESMDFWTQAAEAISKITGQPINPDKIMESYRLEPSKTTETLNLNHYYIKEWDCYFVVKKANNFKK